ncbi:MAG: peptidase U32 family protein [Planctomycetia bacterium]|nr:peptidase U32 family protein [Planctomycetia bacterium]
MSTSETPRPMELLAPAGNKESLRAALDAGADAVYGGLTTLNARRGATNFDPDSLREAVRETHRHGARFHLTLNIDLTQRELGQAVRALELARQCGVDAVLVRDPALVGLIPLFPELEFHFSTQTCVANSADVRAARELGAKRSVLAREMTLKEIAAATAIPGIETEVFCQGALCFCVSGRCLMSSWAGGRSGNRGTCTSPCRVPWKIAGLDAGTPLSMRDLATLRRIRELNECGVTSLKIEGRLRKPEWVRDAVTLYRRAISGDLPRELARDPETLRAGTGREFTWGYLDGERNQMTGNAPGRASGEKELSEPETINEQTVNESAGDETDGETERGTEEKTAESPENAIRTGTAYAIHFDLTGTRCACTCRCGNRTETWEFPRSVVRRAHRAVTLEDVLNYLEVTPVQGVPLVDGSTTDPDFQIMPRTMNALLDRITGTIRLARKPVEDRLRIELPAELTARLERTEPSPMNDRILGTPPDRLRIEASRALEPVRNVRPTATILEGVSSSGFSHVRDVRRHSEPIVALPSVFFENDLDEIRTICERCAAENVAVEVNSWGGWWIAKNTGVMMEAGPGMGVLNAMAARELGKLGCRCVNLSIEADRGQLETLTEICPVPCAMTVFARPVLAISRVRIPDEAIHQIFRDRGDIEMVPRIERRLTVFRPVEPMDLRDLVNDRIHAAHFVVDLTGSPDPMDDLFPAEDRYHRRRGRQNVGRGRKRTLRFNYFRELK